MKSRTIAKNTSVFALAILLSLTTSASAQGTRGGRHPKPAPQPIGGESTSQEFRAYAGQVPEALIAKGMRYFPEVKLAAVEKKAKDKSWQIHEAPNLKVNGAPKDAVSWIDTNMTEVDPWKWNHKSRPKKLALAFHEILVFLKIERNNEYTISNRLLQKSILPPQKKGVFTGVVGEILPENIRSPAVIDVLSNSDQTITFLYCENRNEPSSCNTIGSRNYLITELEALHSRLVKKYAEDERKSWLMPIAVELVGTTIGAVAGAIVTKTPQGAQGGAITGASATVLIAFPVGASFSGDAQDDQKEILTINLARSAAKGQPRRYMKGSLIGLADQLNEILCNNLP